MCTGTDPCDEQAQNATQDVLPMCKNNDIPSEWYLIVLFNACQNSRNIRGGRPSSADCAGSCAATRLTQMTPFDRFTRALVNTLTAVLTARLLTQ